MNGEPTMTKRAVDALTTAALRDLDPAGAPVLTDAELERADATFARILATPGHDHGPEEAARPGRRWARLLVPVGLVGVGVTAMLFDGGPAFASWTPEPEPVPAAAGAAATCRSAFGVSEEGEQVEIAERRGEWTYVLLAGPEGTASCLMPEELVGHRVPGDHEVGFFGSAGTDPAAPVTVARDGIVETGSMGGSFPLPGRWPFTTRDGYVEWVDGHVGSDVTGVTVHPPVGPDVEASVDNGRYAAWWPRGEVQGDNPGAGGAWSYTVTLADGSTREVTGDSARAQGSAS